MNQLSWLLYAADVSNNLRGVATTFFVINIIASVGLLCTAGAICDNCFKDTKNPWGTWKKVAIANVSMFFAAILMTVLLPSKKTVYGIAASEMGEKFTQTTTFNKAQQALNAWLDRQINPTKKGDDK